MTDPASVNQQPTAHLTEGDMLLLQHRAASHSSDLRVELQASESGQCNLSKPSFVAFSGVVFCSPGQEEEVHGKLRRCLAEISTLTLLSTTLPEATQQQNTALPAISTQLFVPQAAAIAATCEPIIRSDLVLWITRTHNRIYYVIVSLAIFVWIVLILAEVQMSLLVQSIGAAVGISFILLHLSSSSRKMIMFILLQTFDAVFLAMQALIMMSAAVLAYRSNPERVNAVAVSVFTLLVPINVMLLAGLDASSAGHRKKSATALLYGALLATVAFKTPTFPAGWHDSVDIAVWSVTPSAMLQSCNITLFIFCAKYFVKALFFSQDAVVLSCPRRVQLEHIVADVKGHRDDGHITDLQWRPDERFVLPSNYELIHQ